MKHGLKGVVLACLLPLAGAVAAQVPTLPDPVAYKCYLCTPDEMRDVALSKGVGVQFVYDFEIPLIAAFDVAIAGGSLTATAIPVEPWVKQQFDSYVNNLGSNGAISFENVKIYASGSDHARALEQPYIVGHHLSLLHPDHVLEREKINRFLQRHAPDFLQPEPVSGRLLRLEYMQKDSITAVLYFGSNYGTPAVFFYDYDTRQWQYVSAKDANGEFIQHTLSDFLPQEYTYYRYSWSDRWYAAAFLDRARWAGVLISGTLPSQYKDISIRCTQNDALQVHCAIE